MESVLEIRHLTKNFGNITAVNNLQLNIPRGSVFGLLGPNGSGKTTSLGMILGVIRPNSGDYSWFGGEAGLSVKKRIGAILETPNFYPYMSGIDNLRLVATIKEIKDPPLEKVLQTVNLSERAGSRFSTYSLGMKQRLAIASALLSDPEVLVLDEPTNGLDPQGIAEIRNIITQIAGRSITVILASHLLDEIEKVCTHVAVLRKGELLFSGTTDELTGHDGVIELRAPDNAEVINALKNFSGIEKIREVNGLITLLLNDETSASEINRVLAQRGIYVDHLVFRKNSLEKQFLDLIGG